MIEIEHQNLYGGSGIVRMKMIDEPLSQPFKAVHLYTLDPLANIGLHQHPTESLLLLCREGAGTIEVNGESKILQPDSVVVVPRAATLTIANTSGTKSLAYWLVRAQS